MNKYFEDCQCQDDFYNKSICGVEFPCFHKTLKSIYLSEEFVEFKKLNSVDIQKFLIHFLQMKINFNQKYDDKSIATTSKEILEYYDLEEKTKLEIQSTSSLISHLYSVFSYTLPNFLEFDERYDQNEFKIEECIPIKIIKKRTSKFEPIVYAVNQIVNVKQMIDCLKV